MSMSLSATFSNVTSYFKRPYDQCVQKCQRSWLVLTGKAVIGTTAALVSAFAIANLAFLPPFLEATSFCAPDVYAPWKNVVMGISSGSAPLVFAIATDTTVTFFFSHRARVAISKLGDRMKDWTESHTLGAITGKGILVASTAAFTALALANAVFFNEAHPLSIGCKHNTIKGFADLIMTIAAESAPLVVSMFAIAGTVGVLKIHHKTRPLPPPPLLPSTGDV